MATHTEKHSSARQALAAGAGLLSLVLISGTGVHAHAQTPLPEDRAAVLETGEGLQDEDLLGEDDVMVVTGTASRVNLRDAPASISVITAEQIEQQPVYNLGEILGRVPGVSGGLSPTGDMSKIKIRGLPEDYTLILINGRRISSSADTNYRPDLGRQDLNWVSPDMIERIEVVRGPMSSIYGSDAMGGVINIITKPIAPVWHGTGSSNYTLPGDQDRGDAYQFALNGVGPVNDRVGLRLGASYTRQNPDEVDLGGRGEALGAGGVSDKNVNGEVTLILAPEQTLSFAGTYGRQEALDPPVPNAAGDAQSAWGASLLERTTVRASYEGDWEPLIVRLDAYRNDYENDVGEEGAAESSETIVDLLVNSTPRIVFEHKLALGAQYREEELTNTRTVGTIPVDYEGNAVSGATLTGDTSALFIEDQIGLRENLLLTLGGRLDSHHRYGEHFSPRAYLVFHPTKSITLRGGVSEGFRAPTLKENSAGAATFSRGGGCGSLAALGYAGGGCYMAGNPDLEPEESVNYEVGASYNRGRLRLATTYFYTDFENKIEYDALGYSEGYWWTRMQNVEKARTEGLEATATVPLTDDLVWRSNGTWMIEAVNVDTGESLITTPELAGFTSLDWNVTDKLGVFLSAQYTGDQLGAGEAITKAYTMLDFAANFDVREWATLRAGVENLTDTEIDSDSGYDYYQPGRRFFVGLTTRF